MSLCPCTGLTTTFYKLPLCSAISGLITCVVFKKAGYWTKLNFFPVFRTYVARDGRRTIVHLIGTLKTNKVTSILQNRQNWT